MAITSFSPTLTKAGLSSAILANNQSVSFKITHISFGNTKFNPTGKETNHLAEQVRVPISASSRLTDSSFKIFATVKHNKPFACYSVGFWSNNVLFAIYSSTSLTNDGIFTVQSTVETIISYTLGLSALNANVIEVNIDQAIDRITQLIAAHTSEQDPHPQYATATGLTDITNKVKPKKITYSTRNTSDLAGHTHEIDQASLTTKGIVQLTNDTGLDSESLALTAKGAKKLATDIANVRLAANAKYTERPATTTQTGTVQLNNTLTSTATNQALTAAQGKALNDKLTPVNVYKVPVKSGATAVTFDLTNRAHWIAEIGAVYKGSGHYQLTFHNNNVSNIANLPLSDKSPVQLDISIMGEFSLVRCHYFYLNRTFTTRVDWNNATFTLAWFEDLKLDNNRKVPRETVFAGSVESNYRMVVRRNQANLSPYYWLVNNAVNVDGTLSARTTLGTIDFKAGKNGTNDGIEKARLGVALLADKNAELEISAKNAEERWVRYLTAFSKTGNVHIGHSSDNQRDRLQINGTANATAPDANANNDQLPTTAWVRNYALGKSGNQTLDGNFTVGKANEWHKLKFPSGKGAFFLETNPASDNSVANSIRFNMKFEQTGQTTKYLSFPEFPNGETVAYRSWVNTGLNGKVNKAGDTMTGDLEVPYLRVKRPHSWTNFISENHASVFLDFTSWNGKHAQCSLESIDIGGFSTEFRMWTTPSGSNYNTDRRQHTFTFNPEGYLWTKAYGWLHDAFVKRDDFVRNYYPNHYAGTEVYKIRHLGLMITVMNVQGGNRECVLPEAYTGHAICLAQDTGSGRINLAGSHFKGGNKIYLAGRGDTSCHVLVIGSKDF